GQLDDHRQTARDRIDLLGLVQLHRRLAELRAIVLVLLLQQLHARRESAHARHRAAGLFGEWIERELQQEGGEYDRETPVLHELVDEGQEPEQRPGQKRERAVV